MIELAAELTSAQATAHGVIVAFVWTGFAALFGIAIGKTIASADRAESSADDETPAVQRRPGDVVELGTRLDVRL